MIFLALLVLVTGALMFALAFTDYQDESRTDEQVLVMFIDTTICVIAVIMMIASVVGIIGIMIRGGA
jgi:hypothetical protein